MAFFRQKALVTQITETGASVMLLQKDACATCSASCAKAEKKIEVKNPHKYPLKVGSLVYLSSSPSTQIVQGIISLLFPFLSALSGFFCASPIARALHSEHKDSVQAVCVLLFLFLSSFIVMIYSRLHPQQGMPEVCQMIDQNSI